ncbi:MAG: hypothetical protein ABSA65_18980 [Acidimicrobiales bacterium]|jgi:hypothetical protein
MACASRDLVVTLGTNAHTLLAGAPVDSVRRRLKLASILYDRVLLEDGTFRAQAGPGGSSAFRHATAVGESPSWQTAHQRSVVKGKTFGITAGLEPAPGVPAPTMTQVFASESVISWDATLEPFAAELPAECDWVHYFERPRRLPDDVGKLAKRWSTTDEHNAVLKDRFPAHFVCSRIVQDTNEDLALAAAAGVVLSADPLHNEVLSRRLQDDQGWRLEGFALPIIVPAVGDLPWDTVRDIRNDKAMGYLRAALRDIELAAMEAATSASDLRSAVHRTVEDELAKANEKRDELRSTIKRSLLGILIATGVGFATTALTGPLGVITVAGGSTALGTVIDAKAALRSKRSRAWVGALARVKSATVIT